MPQGDRTGPRGMGPMTGRGLGIGSGWGRGYWCRGFGGCGHGWRNMDYSPKLEEQVLRNQAAALEFELESVRKRLNEIETEPAPE